MDFPSLFLIFKNDLKNLVRGAGASEVVEYPLRRRASIKDIIQSLGVPQTEVGRIAINREELSFHYIPKGEEEILIIPFTREIPVTSQSILRPFPFVSARKFMVDINAAKLARNLRMAGFDTTIVADKKLFKIGENAAREQRILISRNRDLLKCSSVIFGQLLRSDDHIRQLEEVVDRYNLVEYFKPFSRCLSCNGILSAVPKEEIIDQLEPLTRKYYTQFFRCIDCLKIYWKGSHLSRMNQILEQVR